MFQESWGVIFFYNEKVGKGIKYICHINQVLYLLGIYKIGLSLGTSILPDSPSSYGPGYCHFVLPEPGT